MTYFLRRRRRQERKAKASIEAHLGFEKAELPTDSMVKSQELSSAEVGELPPDGRVHELGAEDFFAELPESRLSVMEPDTS